MPEPQVCATVKVCCDTPLMLCFSSETQVGRDEPIVTLRFATMLALLLVVVEAL